VTADFATLDPGYLLRENAMRQVFLAMACPTGTDNANESRCANGPSTPTNGVRTPAASQIDCSLFATVPLYHAPRALQSPELLRPRFCLRWACRCFNREKDVREAAQEAREQIPMLPSFGRSARHPEARGKRPQFKQQFHPLCAQVGDHEADAGGVDARPIETRRYRIGAWPKTRSEWSRLRLIRKSRYRKFPGRPRVGGTYVVGTVLVDWTRRSNFTSAAGRIEG
jgi:hypothetical protein